MNLRVLIPEGLPLPEPIWRARHRGILVLLWAHVAGLALFAVLTGAEPLHALEEAGVVAVMALLASLHRWGRRFAEAMACMGLLTSSALLVHFSGGYIEMHFHFFVMVGLMALYQDWLPFLLAIGYVVVHHGLVGVLAPESVFNHMAAWKNPWGWAAIHGAFILGMSVVSLIAWRLSEVSHARSELILASAGEGIVGLDAEGRTTFANAAAAAMTGFSVDELIGQPFHSRILAPGDDRPPALPPTEGGVASEMLFRRKDGTTFPVDYVTAAIPEHGGVVGSVVVFSDITRRKQAEDARRESEMRLRSITESAPDAVIATDARGTIVAWNRGAEAMFGFGERDAIGRPLTFLMPERYREAHRRALAQASSMATPTVGRSLEFNGLRKDGTEFPLEVSLGAWDSDQGRFYVGIIRDVTERTRAAEALRDAEHQLRQAQKMEVVGQLAGGIAHDFNNLLTVILGRTNVLLNRIEDGNRLRADIELVATTAARAGALTQQLLAFSRKQVLQPTVLDLNGVVSGMASMLRRLIGEDVTLVTTLEPELAPVRADRAQIEQVIVNLAVNARDAMADGGILTIETAETRLDEDFARRHLGVDGGPYVMIAVSDTGCGMDADLQAHLFEPFFTTKAPGKGTGLGLATVYGIVKQHDGCIVADSTVGKGSTFRLYLPRVTAVVAPSAIAAAPARGNEAILLVEDEPLVRDLAAEILRDNGYTVLAAAPDEAMAVAESHPTLIHLLLTDVVMPGVSGRVLAERLVRVRPEMKVIYMSGYTDDTIVRHGVLDEQTQLLVKPFLPDDLLRKVREVLDR